MKEEEMDLKYAPRKGGNYLRLAFKPPGVPVRDYVVGSSFYHEGELIQRDIYVSAYEHRKPAKTKRIIEKMAREAIVERKIFARYGIYKKKHLKDRNVNLEIKNHA